MHTLLYVFISEDVDVAKQQETTADFEAHCRRLYVRVLCVERRHFRKARAFYIYTHLSTNMYAR